MASLTEAQLLTLTQVRLRAWGLGLDLEGGKSAFTGRRNQGVNKAPLLTLARVRLGAWGLGLGAWVRAAKWQKGPGRDQSVAAYRRTGALGLWIVA